MAGRRRTLSAFGVVLYEMLTGREPLARATATVSATLADMLRTEIELGSLREGTPAADGGSCRSGTAVATHVLLEGGL
jgi:hypothetical protein